MKTEEEKLEELKDKYVYHVGDSLSDFEMVSGRSVILPNDIIPMLREVSTDKQSRWIGVNDRLPDLPNLNDQVIVYVPDIDKIAITTYNHFEDWNNTGFVYRGVTHWMPLPTRPETL